MLSRFLAGESARIKVDSNCLKLTLRNREERSRTTTRAPERALLFSEIVKGTRVGSLFMRLRIAVVNIRC